MKAFVMPLLFLSASHFAFASTASTAKEMPTQSFIVSYDCSPYGRVERSQWTIVAQTSVMSQADGYYDSYDVTFQSSDKNPGLFVDGNTVYMNVQPMRADWPVRTLPIGQFNLQAAACDASDGGSGYGQSFEANSLDVHLSKGISSYITPTTEKCGPNGSNLNALIVKAPYGTYRFAEQKPSSCQ